MELASRVERRYVSWSCADGERQGNGRVLGVGVASWAEWGEAYCMGSAAVFDRNPTVSGRRQREQT